MRKGFEPTSIAFRSPKQLLLGAYEDVGRVS